MTAHLGPSRQALELREAFDRSFATPLREGREDIERFLAVSVGGDRYVVRVGEIAGVLAGRKIVPLPTPSTQLLGLAGNRGAVVPIYDLAMLLGYPGSRTEPSRWILLCGSDPVGLSCGALDGWVEVPRSVLPANEQQPSSRQHVPRVLQTEDGPRGLIDIASTLRAIAKEAAAARAAMTEWAATMVER